MVAQHMMQPGNPKLSSRMRAHGMLRSLVMAMMRGRTHIAALEFSNGDDGCGMNARRSFGVLDKAMKRDERALQLMSLVMAIMRAERILQL
jgi:hypothetical protein